MCERHALLLSSAPSHWENNLVVYTVNYSHFSEALLHSLTVSIHLPTYPSLCGLCVPAAASHYASAALMSEKSENTHTHTHKLQNQHVH